MNINNLAENVNMYSLAHEMHFVSGSKRAAMLRITTESKRAKIVLTVEGRIAGPSVATLEQCWRELYAASPKQKFIVNLCGVSFIDKAGKVLPGNQRRGDAFR